MSLQRHSKFKRHEKITMPDSTLREFLFYFSAILEIVFLSLCTLTSQHFSSPCDLINSHPFSVGHCVQLWTDAGIYLPNCDEVGMFLPCDHQLCGCGHSSFLLLPVLRITRFWNNLHQVHYDQKIGMPNNLKFFRSK